MKKHDEMTLDECRDALAVAAGWLHEHPTSEPFGYWVRGTEEKPEAIRTPPGHPIPPTLDAIAACLPEGWIAELEIDHDGTSARAYLPQHAIPQHGVGAEADTEILARARLAVACHRTLQSPSQRAGAT